MSGFSGKSLRGEDRVSPVVNNFQYRASVRVDARAHTQSHFSSKQIFTMAERVAGRRGGKTWVLRYTPNEVTVYGEFEQS